MPSISVKERVFRQWKLGSRQEALPCLQTHVPPTLFSEEDLYHKCRLCIQLFAFHMAIGDQYLLRSAPIKVTESAATIRLLVPAIGPPFVIPTLANDNDVPRILAKVFCCRQFHLDIRSSASRESAQWASHCLVTSRPMTPKK